MSYVFHQLNLRHIVSLAKELERVEQEGGQEDLTLDHKERKKEEILRIFSSSATSNCSRFKWLVNASISKLKYFFHFLYTHLQKVLPRAFPFVVGKKKRTGLGGLSRLQYKQDQLKC